MLGVVQNLIERQPTPEAEGLELFGACHDRVERQCATLLRMGPHVAEQGFDAAARDAAMAVMRYFELAAPLHHQDEEQDLFPAVSEAALAAGESIPLVWVEELLAQHRQLAELWASLRATLQALCDGQSCDWPLAQVQAFVLHYHAHLALENEHLLPWARSHLAPWVLAQIDDQALARRRLPNV